jgi:hypothetical protein
MCVHTYAISLSLSYDFGPQVSEIIVPAKGSHLIMPDHFSPDRMGCVWFTQVLRISCAHVHTYIHTYMHACIQAAHPSHTNTCMFAHTYTHTYIHTYIHTLAQATQRRSRQKLDTCKHMRKLISFSRAGWTRSLFAAVGGKHHRGHNRYCEFSLLQNCSCVFLKQKYVLLSFKHAWIQEIL